MPSDNPYQAPDSVDDRAFQTPKHNDWDHPVGWIIVAGLNLPVCLGLAAQICRDNHFYGVVPGIAIVMAIGISIRQHKPSVLRCISVGGLVTAVSQFVPILQIICGVIALKVVGIELQPSIDANYVTVALMTVITALLLMTVACLLGAVISVIFPKINPDNDPLDSHPE